MFKFIVAGALFLAPTIAMAQTMPAKAPPSPGDVIASLGAQNAQLSVQIAIDNQQIADLQKQLAALKAPARKPDPKAK